MDLRLPITTINGEPIEDVGPWSDAVDHNWSSRS